MMYRTVYYSTLCCAPDEEGVNYFETYGADRKFWGKIDYKNCASRWPFNTLQYDARYTQRQIIIYYLLSILSLHIIDL
jgi:hypothetical protein